MSCPKCEPSSKCRWPLWLGIVFVTDGDPMHIHGQFFKAIARNGQPVDAPYFRDAVLLRGRETVDVGMVPLDWGRWMIHRHISSTETPG